MPTRASTKSAHEKPGARTASKPATSPANTVMGSTAARVTTSQRVTGSGSTPGGGLVVRRAYSQAARRPVPGAASSLISLMRETLCGARAGAGRRSEQRSRRRGAHAREPADPARADVYERDVRRGLAGHSPDQPRRRSGLLERPDQEPGEQREHRAGGVALAVADRRSGLRGGGERHGGR